jgi:hypothetical protein
MCPPRFIGLFFRPCHILSYLTRDGSILLIKLQKREEKNDASKLFLIRTAQLLGHVATHIEEN